MHFCIIGISKFIFLWNIKYNFYRLFCNLLCNKFCHIRNRNMRFLIHHIIGLHIFAFNQNGQQCPYCIRRIAIISFGFSFCMKYNITALHGTSCKLCKNTVFPRQYSSTKRLCQSCNLHRNFILRSIGNAHILTHTLAFRIIAP